MAEFNYKQIIYAGMVAIAGVDGEVDKTERKWVDKVFDHDFNMSRKERKEVLKIFEGDKDTFTGKVTDELSQFPAFDQREAFKRICQFMLYRNDEYNKSSKSRPKGIDPEKDQLNRYRERADEMRKKLKF
ncbi:MAG: TerB family tellurite resistance protein [Bacteroidales bacterium]|nr:TerB family tellurite resistance protein [Bacteroidales bacterium]